jgi:hypothetical protein
MIGEISRRRFYKLRLRVQSHLRKARVDQELGAKHRFNPAGAGDRFILCRLAD